MIGLAHICHHRNSECLNYLKDVQGSVINAVMAGAAFNFKRWLNQKLQENSGCVQKMIRNWSESKLGDPLPPELLSID